MKSIHFESQKKRGGVQKNVSGPVKFLVKKFFYKFSTSVANID